MWSQEAELRATQLTQPPRNTPTGFDSPSGGMRMGSRWSWADERQVSYPQPGGFFAAGVLRHAKRTVLRDVLNCGTSDAIVHRPRGS